MRQEGGLSSCSQDFANVAYKISQPQTGRIKMKVQHAELFHFIKSPIVIHDLNLLEKFKANTRGSINILQHCKSVVQNELAFRGIWGPLKNYL